MGLSIRAANVVLTCRLQPVKTQVTRTALEQSHPDGQTHDRQQARNVPGKELVLQCFGRGRDQRPLTGQQDGDQIGVGLAHTGACFDHELTTLLDGLCNGLGHLLLTRTFLKTHGRDGQGAGAREKMAHPILEFAQAGSRGCKRACQ